MRNPNPRTDQLFKFPSPYDRPLAKIPLSVRVLPEAYNNFLKIPTDTRNKKLREAIDKIILDYGEEQENS